MIIGALVQNLRLLLAVFLLLFLTPSASAHEGIRFCNNIPHKVWYARFYHGGMWSNKTHVIKGWQSLDPGECTSSRYTLSTVARLDFYHGGVYAYYSDSQKVRETLKLSYFLGSYQCIRKNKRFSINQYPSGLYRDSWNNKGLYNSCLALGDDYRVVFFQQVPTTFDQSNVEDRVCTVTFYQHQDQYSLTQTINTISNCGPEHSTRH